MRLDQYLIAIPLSCEQKTIVKVWLERFLMNVTFRWGDANIAGGMLWIHPADFPNLLSQAHSSDCTELEFYRIRKLGSKAVTISLGRRRAKVAANLFNMVTDALIGLNPEECQNDSFLEIHLPDTI